MSARTDTDKGAKTRAARHPSKLPWLRWSFDAWMSDPGLRLCSVLARGVWIDLLAVAARSSEPGFLAHMGRPMTARELGQHTNIRATTIERALKELEANGVFSRDGRGAIFSRRMVRDFEDHALFVAFGKQGGNPALVGGAAADSGGGQEAATERARDACVPPTVHGRDARVPPTQHATHDETGDNNDLDEMRVNPPLKADSESDSEVQESAPGGADAEAASSEWTDASALLRTEGVAALVRLTAMRPEQACGFIGRMLARAKDDADCVLDAIRRCEAVEPRPIEPKSWLMGAVSSGGVRRGEFGEVVPLKPRERRPARNGGLELILRAREAGAVILPTLDDLPMKETGHG